MLLIGLGFLDCTQTALAVTLLTIAVSLSGCVFSGYFVNHMDIAPQYAGTLMGISNGVAASSGFIAPYVASILTTAVSVLLSFRVCNYFMSSIIRGCATNKQTSNVCICMYAAAVGVVIAWHQHIWRVCYHFRLHVRLLHSSV